MNNYFATATEKELANETGIDSVAGADDDGKIRDVGHYSLRTPPHPQQEGEMNDYHHHHHHHPCALLR